MKRYAVIAVLGGIVSLGIIAATIVLAANPSEMLRLLGRDSASGARVFDLADFPAAPGLQVNGPVELKIRSGEPSLEMRGSLELLDRVDIQQGPRQLTVNIPDDWILGGPVELELVLPDFESLKISGSATVEIESVEREKLAIEVSGSAEVFIDEGRVQNLELSFAGAAKFRAEDFASVNAQVSLAGASSVHLNMAGGNLGGSITGAGEITYSGSIAQNTVKITGFGNIEKED